jgi:hypothetical protein
MRCELISTAALLGVAVLAGCGSEDDQQPTERIANSDTAFRGLRVGDSFDRDDTDKTFGPRCNATSAGACEAGLGAGRPCR